MLVLKFWTFAIIVFLVHEVNCILVQDVYPESYTLKLVPLLDNGFNFTGEVFIDIRCNFSTTEIVLHSSNLTIVRVEVLRNGQEFPSTYELRNRVELLFIKTEDYMATNGEYTIHIKYQGYLNDDMVGFYRSSYKIGRQTRWLATTQFQSNFARMAFPCFDEPRHRTVFNISVARYKNQIALSNMPVKEITDEDPTINNRVWVIFESTPPMSTYLVAVVVSDFKRFRSKDGRISVWARENVVRDTEYSFHQSSVVLESLEDYTGIKYNLPKLDLIAVPDFKAGAMENWGLTIYRERSVIYQDDNSSAKQMELITSIIVHELAHQWFGNYVTPKWWDYSWLNEAFATYLKYYLTAKIEPTWRMDQFFVTDVLQNALFVDEVNYHHAMTSSVKTTSEIEEIFDTITYQKGASVLRMFEQIISSMSFQEALKYYLMQGHEDGGIVEPENLWRAFDRQAYLDKLILPLPPSELMKNWTTNRGYPLINVTRIVKNNSVIIEQLTYKSPRSTTEVPDQKWIVPLTFTTSRSLNFSDTRPTHWIGINSLKIHIQIPLKHYEWIIFNKQQLGFYRVNYDLDNWKLLVKELHSHPEKIHEINRAQLIDDSFALAIDEKLPYDVPINLATYLSNETDMIPWFSAIKNFNYLFSQFENTAINNTVKKYLEQIIDNQYKRIGFIQNETDDHLMKTGRTVIINLACSIGYSDCITRMKKEYEYHTDDLSKVPAYLKYPVYCTMLNHGNTDIVWSKLWALYKTTEFDFEIETILSTVGCMNDEKLIANILDKLINDNDNDIRKQNRIFVQRSIYQTTNGVTATINFIANLLSKPADLNSSTIIKIASIAKKIKSKIKSEEQTVLLKKLITIINQENKNFTTITNILRIAHNEGVKRIQLNRKRMDELKAAIENSMLSPSSFTNSITKQEEEDTTTPSPSSSAHVISLNWIHTLSFGIIFIYLKPFFRIEHQNFHL